MDCADILQSMKNKKSIKYLKFRVALNSLRTVWQVFDTFFHLPGQTHREVQILVIMDGMCVDDYMIYVRKR